MRLFKSRPQLNWKYIIGEILLIFVGISLAIWFNNWNASSKMTYEKSVAIRKIKEEIQSNINELTKAKKDNEAIAKAFYEYEKIFKGNSTELLTTPQHFNELQQKYPGFFQLIDSTHIHQDTFYYRGGTFINLEIAELTDIAWETTRSISITNNFDYECLYELASMYNLQNRVQTEIDKAVDALQRRELKELLHILEFIKQLDSQLVKDYEAMLSKIDNCN